MVPNVSRALKIVECPTIRRFPGHHGVYWALKLKSERGLWNVNRMLTTQNQLEAIIMENGFVQCVYLPVLAPFRWAGRDS